jgi:ketosteroid isomerase-like protein
MSTMAEPDDPNDPNVAALRTVYREWGRGNWRARLDLYGPDMEWEWSTEFPDIHGTTRDMDEANERLRTFLAQFEDWRSEAERFIPAGDKVVVLTRYAGSGKGSGAEVYAEGAHVWTMRVGKAARLQIFSDRRRAVEAAGLEPAE